MIIGRVTLFLLSLLAAEFAFSQPVPAEEGRGHEGRLKLYPKSKAVNGEGVTVDLYDTVYVLPKKSAVIICDMWDRHWCKGATERVKELAPSIDLFLHAAREQGALVVHAPSNCIDYYKDTPARKRAASYPDRDLSLDKWMHKTGAESGHPWPIDSLTEGCNDSPYCTPGKAWTKQIDAIAIKDEDAISDSGSEIAALFEDLGIEHVFIAGVHTNMCIVGRSFGIRSLKRLGYDVMLVRDLTDAMYDSRQWPYVSHFKGLGLMVNYIEQYLCPTVTSSELTGTAAFRFREDDRPER